MILFILNRSLELAEFPTCLKQAVVKPVIKNRSGDIDALSNYRPIHNLAFLSKICEKIALFRLLDHVNGNSLFCLTQSGYRYYHSCETVMIKMHNDILGSMNQNKLVAVLLLDLSAAFDVIDHNLLLDMLLEDYCISGSALLWFKSYLSGRSFNVKIDD